MTQGGSGSGTEENAWRNGEVVPLWLVAVVVVLFLIAAGLGTYVTVTMVKSSAERRAATARSAAEAGRSMGDIDSSLQSAYQLQQSAQWAEAVRVYDWVLEKDPDNLGARYNKGLSLIELGKVAEAETELREVLTLAPEHALAAKGLGELLESTGHYEEVPALVLPASKANPQIADLHVVLGIAYEKNNRPEDAEAHYRAALRTVPDLAAAKKGLARIQASAK